MPIIQSLLLCEIKHTSIKGERYMAININNKTIGIIAGTAAGLALLITTGVFGVKHYKEFIVEPDFYVTQNVLYSAGVDADWAYAQNRKEFSVGENCYMKYKLSIKSSNSKGDGKEVGLTISIPKISSVQATKFDGNPILPEHDEINNVTTYKITAIAYKNVSDKQEFGCVFQYVPNDVGYIQVTFIFDNPIKSSYNMQSTIVFVQPSGE